MFNAHLNNPRFLSAWIELYINEGFSLICKPFQHTIINGLFTNVWTYKLTLKFKILKMSTLQNWSW